MLSSELNLLYIDSSLIYDIVRDLNSFNSEIIIPNFVSSVLTSSTDYIYETCSNLLSGGLVRYNTGESFYSLSNWTELLPLLNTTGVIDSKYLNESIMLSILSLGYDSLTALNYNSPVSLVLSNPEVVTIINDSNTLFDELFVTSKVLIRSDFINVINVTLVNFVSYLSVISLIYLFIIFYFYTNNKLNTSESSSDNDYLSIWALTESEKELGSADDLVLLIIVITYIFGWFFGANFYFIVTRLPEFMTFVFSIPGLFYVVFSIPSYFIYDYGIFYGTYLRGASISSFFLYEFGYDIIMICVFYIRLALQAIRLVLMTIACASYYDYVMFYNYKSLMFVKQADSLIDTSSIFNVATYWFLVKVPGTLMYIAYEVLHLWFILISQTISFFAMIFWLFLYLYSFFLIIAVEGFFNKRRAHRLLLLNNRLSN